jgi:hypothetical protein
MSAHGRESVSPQCLREPALVAESLLATALCGRSNQSAITTEAFMNHAD